MAGGNPVLTRAEKEAVQTGGAAQAAAYQTSVAGGPAAPPVSTGRRMTMDDVIVKTGIVFVVLLAGAVAGWNLMNSMPWVVWVAAFVAFGFAMAVSFMKRSSPLMVILYSVFEGVFLGGISKFYQSYGEANGNGNLVLQAVGATFVVFAVMLIVYKTGIVKVTERTRKVFMVMILSYLVIALISLVSAFFGVGQGWGFYGVGGIGIILCLFAVGLAAFSLVIDFDSIVRTTQYGVEERESWRMAFGLMVSLVWLYLEILRLLAIVNRN